MTNKTVHINAKLYSTLFNEGLERGVDSDRLIAVFVILKASRENGAHRIIKKGKLTRYRLLNKVTKLSEKTLKKYVPILESLGIVNFSKDGGVYIKGNDKLNKEFQKRKTIKLEVGTLHQTSLNSFFVRVKAKEKRIKSAIDKTDAKIKVMGRFEARKWLNQKDFAWASDLSKEGVTLAELQSHHNKVVLSNCGFYNLKKEVKDKKGSGFYWKNKLKSAGKIKTRINSKLIRKASKMEYLLEREHNPRLSFYKGHIYEQTASEFTTSTFTEKTVITAETKKPTYKKKEYLQFDMIDFWMAG